MRLLVVVGSTRPVRIGDQLAAEVGEILQAQPAVDEVEVVDLALLALPPLDEPEMPVLGRYAHAHTKRWAAMVDGADGLVFVTPQYNFGYPAPVKNAIDYLAAEWRGKPALIVSYGGRGGQQSAAQLRQVLTFVGARLAHDIAIPVPREGYGEDGTLTDPAAVVKPARGSVEAAARELSALAATPVTDGDGARSLFAVPDDALDQVQAFVDAFNQHDAELLAGLFRADALFIDVVAHRLRGSDAIKSAHEYAFRGPLAQARLQVDDQHALLIAAGTATVDTAWHSDGHAGTGVDRVGDTPRRGVLVLTLHRDPATGRWDIVSGVNNDYTHTYTGNDAEFVQTMRAPV